MDPLAEFCIRDESPITAEVILGESAIIGDWYESAGVVILEGIHQAEVGDPILVAGVPRVVIRHHAQVRAGGPKRTRIDVVDGRPAE